MAPFQSCIFCLQRQNVCICFLQKYQHPTCFTQAICLDSNCSLNNANNECFTLLFHNNFLAHAYLGAVTMCAVSNVEGIHQQSLRLRWDQSVGPIWLQGHVKWLDCHPRHFPWKKKHGVSIKLIHEEVRVFGWTWQFLIAAASQHLSHSHVGHCEMVQKIDLHLVFGPALHAILYLRKRHPVSAISNSAHSQRHPSKYVPTSSQQSALSSATGAPAEIAKCQSTKKAILCYTWSNTHHAKTSNAWMISH